MNVSNLCLYCLHPTHPSRTKCGFAEYRKAPCKCKGKPGFWSEFFDRLGNAIGNAKFGGN
jgi:hypothetical protein